MNLHMPQDPESEAELRNLAAVPYQIISPGNNSPIIGIYQDSMLGSYQFTRENIKFTPRDAMNILMMFNRVNEQELAEALTVNNGKISNFNILTQIMAPLTLKYKTKAFNDDKDDPKKSNAFLEIIKITHSLYVLMKMKSSWREREINQLREDISTILWDLQRLFNTEVDLTVDDRTPEETFSFIGPLR
jgi:DNA-directed RNA polymerase beta' subunit